MAPEDSRAILNPTEGARAFTLERRPPSPDLAPTVRRHWVVRWDLRGRAPFAQETLPYPCVNLVFGTHQPGVHGILRRRFVADLRGEGWVLGVKFRAGTFRGLLGRDVATIADRALTVAEVFGQDGHRLEDAVLGTADDGARVGAIEAFLRDRGAGALAADAALARDAAELAECDASVTRVDALARRAGLAPRTLERLFRAHVGASPKWVIRTFRVQQAAERVKAGAPPDWAGLAQELGYFDQAHLIRDFKALVGATPAAYAARCAGAAAAATALAPASPRSRSSDGASSAGATG